MLDRNPAGRDTDEGNKQAVTDRSVEELLRDLIDEVRKLRLSFVFANQGLVAELGDEEELAASLGIG